MSIAPSDLPYYQFRSTRKTDEEKTKDQQRINDMVRQDLLLFRALVLGGDRGWRLVGAIGQPGFLNGWVVAGSETPGFRKDALGFVHIEGRVQGGTGNSDIFQLPVGYRPKFNQYFAAPQTDSTQTVNQYGRVTVTASTGMVSSNLTSTGAWQSLAGITFLAEA